MRSDTKQRVISLLVEDHPGVLNRVSGLVRRRGFNISALSVAPSEQAGFSRMTLTVHAGHSEVDQVEKQLDRLIEVVEVTDLTEFERIHRELVVGRADDSAEPLLTEAGATLLHRNGHGLVFEYTGDAAEAEQLIQDLKAHGLRELTRSGPVAVRR
ncbi:MAG TPA: acetolactate synthase small subunit [Candidatus Dormibacteraeota bacterium]